MITDAIHPDPFRPEHRHPRCAISAQSLPRAMDTIIRGARTLCAAAAAFVTVELRCCSADNKAQSFIPFCCNADGDASVSAPASTSKQIIAFCSSSFGSVIVRFIRLSVIVSVTHVLSMRFNVLIWNQPSWNRKNSFSTKKIDPNRICEADHRHRVVVIGGAALDGPERGGA